MRWAWIVALAGLCHGFNYHTPHFQTHGLHPLPAQTIATPNGTTDCSLAAYGDWNADAFADLFLLCADRSLLIVAMWARDAFAYNTHTAPLNVHRPGSTVVNIVPADFDNNAHLDALVVYQKDSTFSVSLWLSKDAQFLPTPLIPEVTFTAEPIVVDVSGLGQVEIMGQSNGKVSVWRYNSTEKSLKSIPFNTGNETMCQWASPHSNAYVDLNGDCLADLLIVCSPVDSKQRVQLWINRKSEGFRLARELDLPAGSGQLSLGDMNADGTVDLIFPVCSSDKCDIRIIYNQQISICKRGQKDNCRSLENLCSADDNFLFNTTQILELKPGHFLLSPRNDDRKKPLLAPLRVYVADLSLNGFPDIVYLTGAKQASIGDDTSAVLMRNLPCSKTPCAFDRTFVDYSNDLGPLKDKGNFVSLSFVDLDEQGKIDIIATEFRDQKTSLKPFFNNYYNDAFFVKTLITNGVCFRHCRDDEYQSEIKPRGVNYVGGTFKLTILDTNGHKRAAIGHQLPQTSHVSLQTPYTLMGLGRTNNYVEEFVVGVPKLQDTHTKNWAGIIPNSQLVVYPYQAPGQTDTDSWVLELYISPAGYVVWVLLVVVVSMFVLFVAVLALQIAEKREDEAEKRRALHVINFDAL